MRTIFVRICLIFIVILLFSACSWPLRGDDPELLATADFGPYPEKENIKQLVRARLKNILFDPYSLRDFEILNFKQGWYRPAGNKRLIIYGYETRVYFNAKNRMGGYVGLQKYFLFVHNGVIIEFGKPEEIFGRRFNAGEFYTRPDKMKK